jgi:hypothetical protein
MSTGSGPVEIPGLEETDSASAGSAVLNNTTYTGVESATVTVLPSQQVLILTSVEYDAGADDTPYNILQEIVDDLGNVYDAITHSVNSGSGNPYAQVVTRIAQFNPKTATVRSPVLHPSNTYTFTVQAKTSSGGVSVTANNGNISVLVVSA